MGISDLLLIVSAFLVFASLVGILYAVVARKWSLLGRLSLGLGIYIGLYAAALVAVSLSSPQEILPMHQPRCFDEWCASVEKVERRPAVGAAQAQGVFYLVTLQVTSEAKRISQRALDATVFVVDQRGNRYAISKEGQQALQSAGQAGQPLNSLVDAGGSFTYTAVFDLPADIAQPGLVISHGAFPGLIVIGDSQSFLHKPTVVMIPVK